MLCKLDHYGNSRYLDVTRRGGNWLLFRSPSAGKAEPSELSRLNRRMPYAVRLLGKEEDKSRNHTREAAF
jgi:hypothetical protein